MKNPFFTIVIPTHNREDLLPEAIHSVLGQTLDNYELIIVDDHSTDSTRDVIASFEDSRIRCITNDRTKGGAGARNAGIFIARGVWTAFLDDDDVWLPQKLELQYEQIMELDHSVGMIYTGYAYYNFDRKCELSRILPEKDGWVQRDLLYRNYIGTFSTVIIRSDFLQKIGGLDERFESMQDMELYVRISGTYKIASVSKVLSYVRSSNKDRISLNFQKKLNASLLFREKYKTLINRSVKLRHRAASIIFNFALKEKKWRVIFKVLPWTFLGLFFDINNFLKTLWGIFLFIFRNRPIKNQ